MIFKVTFTNLFPSFKSTETIKLIEFFTIDYNDAEINAFSEHNLTESMHVPTLPETPLQFNLLECSANLTGRMPVTARHTSWHCRHDTLLRIALNCGIVVTIRYLFGSYQAVSHHIQSVKNIPVNCR